MMISASRGNKVVLITFSRVVLPEEVRNLTIQLCSIETLETEALTKFIQYYKPWGLQEPWEQQNTERYFILAKYMKSRHIFMIFFADSDVAVLVPITHTLWNTSNVCDCMVSLQNNSLIMKWKTGDWVAWAGTSILSNEILQDFIQFATRLYQGKYVKLLEYQRDNWPYVNDMTLWYLFIGASDNELAKAWEWPKWPKHLLPNTTQYHFCDINSMGFVHQGGYIKTKK
jgi:hypothetical protein